MKLISANQLNSQNQLYGAFNSITTLSDRYHADGVDYPFGAIGDSQIIDVDLPSDFLAENYTWNGSALVAKTIPCTQSDIANFLAKIGADYDAIYSAVVGTRGIEYQNANTDAANYKAAGYTGTVPAGVSSWATAAGKTAQWAADNILAQAAAWRSAQDSIRLNRLVAKQGALAANLSTSQLATISANWASFVTSIRGQLGLS